LKAVTVLKAVIPLTLWSTSMSLYSKSSLITAPDSNAVRRLVVSSRRFMISRSGSILSVSVSRMRVKKRKIAIQPELDTYTRVHRALVRRLMYTGVHASLKSATALAPNCSHRDRGNDAFPARWDGGQQNPHPDLHRYVHAGTSVYIPR
jgi:hypothetical protein